MLSLEEFDRTAWHALALSGYVPITVYHDSSFRRGIARLCTWAAKKQAAHGLELLDGFLTSQVQCLNSTQEKTSSHSTKMYIHKTLRPHHLTRTSPQPSAPYPAAPIRSLPSCSAPDQPAPS